MAHEIHDDGFHEIQLSGKQLVFLFMATTVVFIVIFLCGILVGRGVQNGRTLAEAAGLDSATSDAGDVDAASAPQTGQPTSVPGLSYPDNLNAANGEPPPVVAGAASDMAKPRPSETPAAPAPAELAPPVAAVKAAPKADDPPKDAVPTAAPSTAPAPAEDGGFTVQVTALKNKPEADGIAQRLQTRGFKAYVVAPGAGGQVIYKVRVGVNMQRQEADKVMRRLQSEEKFKPWITR